MNHHNAETSLANALLIRGDKTSTPTSIEKFGLYSVQEPKDNQMFTPVILVDFRQRSSELQKYCESI